MQTRECIKPVKCHNGKSYKKGDKIEEREYNNLTFRERTEHFIAIKKESKVEGIGNEYANEL